MIDRRDRVLPQLGLGHPRAEVPRHRTHVAVQQLVPRLGEGLGELIGVLVEALGDRPVDRIHPQRQVRREHDRGVALRRIVSVRHGVLGLGIRGCPLLRSGRALRQVPVVLVQVVQVPVVPLRRLVRPGTLEPARERVGAGAAAVAVLPPETLVIDGTPLGLWSEVFGIDRTMGLADRVSADDQGDGLLVVHGHPTERLADVPGRIERARVAVGTLRVDVDQAHLHGTERTGELPIAGVALIAEPGVFRAPEDLLGLPDVLAPEAEAERLEAHRLVGAVAGEDEEVGPRDLLAVLLLDRPEQPAGLVEAHVVGPAVEGGEALRAASRATATVGDAIRAGGVPRHADEQRPVVAVVGRPPVLRRRHRLEDVLLEGFDIEALELLGVVEVLAQRIRARRVLVKDLQRQLIRPPVLVRIGSLRLGFRCGDDWVFALRHGRPSPLWMVAADDDCLLLSPWRQRTRGIGPNR